MEIVVRRCAGIDVHKREVVVCVRRVEETGKVHKEVCKFATMTRDLLALVDYLRANAVEKVAMEATGVYWKPVFNLMEGESWEMVLFNAEHAKNYRRDKKTDVRDCEWISDLLQHGLVQGSFIPPPAIRDLRDLTRQRTILVREKNRVVNRIQKVLEEANVKLASVATDVVGVSGRKMLEALVCGEEDVKKLAQLAVGRLRKKRGQLEMALEGRVTAHHRFLLREHLDHLRFLEMKIGEYEEKIVELCACFEEEVELLKTIPGVLFTVAAILIAEIGVDMSQFPSSAHLSSWGGMCPGNRESGGKRQSGKSPKGSVWLKRALVQAAWAASHQKNTYLSSLYHHLRKRRGSKRALVAVGHAILGSAYHILKDKVAYYDLGPIHLNPKGEAHLVRAYIRRLERLGYEVELKKVPEAA